MLDCIIIHELVDLSGRHAGVDLFLHEIQRAVVDFGRLADPL